MPEIILNKMERQIECETECQTRCQIEELRDVFRTSESIHALQLSLPFGAFGSIAGQPSVECETCLRMKQLKNANSTTLWGWYSTFSVLFFFPFPSLLRSLLCFRFTGVFPPFFFGVGVATIPVISFCLHGRFVSKTFHLLNKNTKPSAQNFSLCLPLTIIQFYTILWLRNWLGVSWGLRLPGGLFIEWLRMRWGVLHILVSVAILGSACSFSG